jgi:N-acetylmuramoyl-L-alanine amidase
MGYLTNRREAALLRSSSFQNRLAQAIADGIIDYFN